MRKYLFAFALSFPFLLFAQNTVSVKEKEYEGYIFDKGCSILFSIENQKDRYTPTIEDVRCAERLLNDNITYLKEHQSEKNKGYPVIYKKLKKYKRQYVGYLNQDGDIVIWIFFMKDYQDSCRLSKDIIVMSDGGSNYWSIIVNLTKKTLYDMKINGVS